MPDNNLRDKIVMYFIVGLLAAVILFLVYGLVKGDGDDTSSAPSSPSAPAKPQPPVKVEAQVGCQQPAAATKLVKGKKTIPPNPGVSAKASGKRAAVISVTVPISTQECRVTQIQVQLDSTQDKVPAVVRTIDVTTGPPTHKVKITLSRRSGPPQVALGASITPDGRTSSGAIVSVR